MVIVNQFRTLSTYPMAVEADVLEYNLEVEDEEWLANHRMYVLSHNTQTIYTPILTAKRGFCLWKEGGIR